MYQHSQTHSEKSTRAQFLYTYLFSTDKCPLVPSLYIYLADKYPHARSLYIYSTQTNVYLFVVCICMCIHNMYILYTGPPRASTGLVPGKLFGLLVIAIVNYLPCI